jgi:hypothetical protein
LRVSHEVAAQQSDRRSDTVTVRRPFRICVGVLAVAALAAGCQTVMSNSEIPTITVSELARDLDRGQASFRDRNVRVCRGRLDRMQPAESRKWAFAAVGDPFPHGASVFVNSCRGEPVPDSQGCLQGRIAPPDRSLSDPSERVISSSIIESYDWYLHVNCRSPEALQSRDGAR